MALPYEFDHSLWVKLIESKNLFSGAAGKAARGEICCTVTTDGQHERRTPLMPVEQDDAYHGDEFRFEKVAAAAFQNLQISLIGAGSRVLGHVAISRLLLQQGAVEDEQWFAVNPPDVPIARGQILLAIQYVVDSEDTASKNKRFLVSVLKARDLQRGDGLAGCCDPYVVLGILPDSQTRTLTATQTLKSTNAPVFNQDFVFAFDSIHPNQALTVSVWDSASGSSDTDVLLGHYIVPLSDIVTASRVTPTWYPLLGPLAHHLTALALPGRRRGGGGSGKEPHAPGTLTLPRARRFIQALQTPPVKHHKETKSDVPHKLIDTKFASVSFCGCCGGMMAVARTHYQCSVCKMSVHVHCAKNSANNCKSIPAVRFKARFVTLPVLPLERYTPFREIMTKQTFRLVTMFGDVSQEREQAAGSLLRLYESQGLCIDFIASLTQVEIERCTEPNTLFRGNSIATKTLDGYMKMKAGDYLKTVLGDTVRQILSKKPNCEIDPTRLDSKDARKKNLKTLMDWNNRIVQGIFSAAPQFPPALRVIFHRMQICIIRRFPNETNTHIVAVAGFVFLRFFAAAILGPRLFGLTEEYIDPKTARVFTLLAKTLQSLANLNLFGSKEPYMEDMNPFIQQNMQGMRDYIHTLTKRVEVPATTRERSMLTYTPEVDLSNLVEMFSRCKSEILQQLKPGEGPMGREFATIIKDLTVEIETARVMAGMYESASNESAYDHRSRLTLQTRRPQTTDVVPSPADAAQTSLPDSPQPLSARSNATLPASSAIRETPTCYVQLCEGPAVSAGLAEGLSAKVMSATHPLAYPLAATSSASGAYGASGISGPTTSPTLGASVGTVPLSHPYTHAAEYAATAGGHAGVAGAHAATISTSSLSSASELLAGSAHRASLLVQSGAASGTPAAAVYGASSVSGATFLSSSNISTLHDLVRTNTHLSSLGGSPIPTISVRPGLRTVTRPELPFGSMPMRGTNPMLTALATHVPSAGVVASGGGGGGSGMGANSTPMTTYAAPTALSMTAPASASGTSSAAAGCLGGAPLSASAFERRPASAVPSLALATGVPILIPAVASACASPVHTAPPFAFPSPASYAVLPGASPAAISASSTTATAATAVDGFSATPMAAAAPSAPPATAPSVAVLPPGPPADKRAAMLALLSMAGSEAQREAHRASALVAAIKPRGTCRPCNKPVYSDDTTCITNPLGDVFHQACVACQVCKARPLTSATARWVRGLWVCEADAQRAASLRICAGCETAIQGPAVACMENYYHRTCFCCTDCETPLESFIPYRGLPYCRTDYYKQAGLMCGTCGDVIETQFIEFSGRKYHLPCKLCDYCREPLAGRSYFNLGEETFCSSHASALLTCQGCHHIIAAQANGGPAPLLRTRVGQKSYHPSCFACRACHQKVDALNYYEKGGDPFCQSCYISTFDLPTRAAAAAAVAMAPPTYGVRPSGTSGAVVTASIGAATNGSMSGPVASAAAFAPPASLASSIVASSGPLLNSYPGSPLGIPTPMAATPSATAMAMGTLRSAGAGVGATGTMVGSHAPMVIAAPPTHPRLETATWGYHPGFPAAATSVAGTPLVGPGGVPVHAPLDASALAAPLPSQLWRPLSPAAGTAPASTPAPSASAMAVKLAAATAGSHTGLDSSQHAAEPPGAEAVGAIGTTSYQAPAPAL